MNIQDAMIDKDGHMIIRTNDNIDINTGRIAMDKSSVDEFGQDIQEIANVFVDETGALIVVKTNYTIKNLGLVSTI